MKAKVHRESTKNEAQEPILKAPETTFVRRCASVYFHGGYAARQALEGLRRGLRPRPLITTGGGKITKQARTANPASGTADVGIFGTPLTPSVRKCTYTSGV